MRTPGAVGLRGFFALKNGRRGKAGCGQGGKRVRGRGCDLDGEGLGTRRRGMREHRDYSSGKLMFSRLRVS